MAPIRALIVDDSSVMRNIIDRTLLQAGLELEMVYEASTGNEALELLQKRQVHLILSEINLPSMDGLEFLNQPTPGHDTPIVAPSHQSQQCCIGPFRGSGQTVLPLTWAVRACR